MDLVKYLPLLSHAVAATLGALYVISVVANAALRVLPAAWIVYVERKLPRLAWLLRALRKIGGDLVPALQALYRTLTGTAYEPGKLPPAGVAVVVESKPQESGR